jgi:AcrR family transcriptional regulator
MTGDTSAPSKRRDELLQAAYSYVLEHGLADLSLRPLATAIGSSPRVLLYLFGSKDGLLLALLARARADELKLLARVRSATETETKAETGANAGLAEAAVAVWTWLAAPSHRPILMLWVEGYARSLVDPAGPWADFARTSVEDWLTLLAEAQTPDRRDSPAGIAERTLVLAVLRGAMLDLLATGEVDRISPAVHRLPDLF